MAEGRAESLWSHTSHVLALLANVHRDPKRTSRPFAPADFNPFSPGGAKREPKVMVKMSEVKNILTGKLNVRDLESRR